MEITLWAALSLLVAVFAYKKGLSPFWFFVLSLFLSPLTGIILIWMLEDY